MSESSHPNPNHALAIDLLACLRMLTLESNRISLGAGDGVSSRNQQSTSSTTTSPCRAEVGDCRRTRLLSILESAYAISAPMPLPANVQHQYHPSRSHLLHVLERASSASAEDNNDRHRASIQRRTGSPPARTSGTVDRRSGANPADGYRRQ